MAKIYHMATRQAQASEVGPVVRGSDHRQHPVKRRWNAEKCVPLQLLTILLAWIIGGLAFCPIWLWMARGYQHKGLD